MSYNSNLQSKNTKIQSLIDKANALPDKTSGVELPTLSNPAEVSEIFLDKEVIGQNGQIKTGTFTLANELDTQDDLIAQIQVALQNKASASEPILQSKMATPSTSIQIIEPDTGYDGLSAVSIDAMPTATQATPSITVNSSGLITASATQSAGYVSAGTKSATKQLTTKAAATITPTTTSQVAVSSGTYTTGNITVAAIPSDYIIPSGTLTITTNGTHNVKNYASATVSIAGAENTQTFDQMVDGSLVNCTNSTITKIRDYAFENYSKLQSVNFTSCSHVGQEAFNNCTALKTVVFPACTSMASSAFAKCVNLTSISFPVCKSVYWAGFSSCSALTTVDLPECTYLGGRAFQYCTKLNTISLPLCRQIYSSTFQSCSALKTISLPAATLIGSTAFGNCINLSTFYLAGSSVCALSGSNAFTSTKITSTSGSIFVNASLVDSYKAATNWAYFSNVIYAIE